MKQKERGIQIDKGGKISNTKQTPKGLFRLWVGLLRYDMIWTTNRSLVCTRTSSPQRPLHRIQVTPTYTKWNNSKFIIQINFFVSLLLWIMKLVHFNVKIVTVDNILNIFFEHEHSSRFTVFSLSVKEEPHRAFSISKCQIVVACYDQTPSRGDMQMNLCANASLL